MHINCEQGTVECWERHGEPHRQWELNASVKDQILGLNYVHNEYWLDGELLHNKTTDPHYKNRIVLYDVLFAGKYLYKGPTTEQRQELLFDLCHKPAEREAKHGIALVATENIWLAETFPAIEMCSEYQRHIDTDEIEGIVLKKRTAKIDNLGKKEYDVSWQVRCRKEHKNYSF